MSVTSRVPSRTRPSATSRISSVDELVLARVARARPAVLAGLVALHRQLPDDVDRPGRERGRRRGGSGPAGEKQEAWRSWGASLSSPPLDHGRGRGFNGRHVPSRHPSCLSFVQLPRALLGAPLPLLRRAPPERRRAPGRERRAPCCSGWPSPRPPPWAAAASAVRRRTTAWPLPARTRPPRGAAWAAGRRRRPGGAGGHTANTSSSGGGFGGAQTDYGVAVTSSGSGAGGAGGPLLLPIVDPAREVADCGPQGRQSSTCSRTRSPRERKPPGARSCARAGRGHGR